MRCSLKNFCRARLCSVLGREEKKEIFVQNNLKNFLIKKEGIMKRQRQKRLQNKIYFELLKKAQDKDMVDTKMA